MLLYVALDVINVLMTLITTALLECGLIGRLENRAVKAIYTLQQSIVTVQSYAKNQSGDT